MSVEPHRPGQCWGRNCLCRDRIRSQAENRDRLDAATDAEKDDVLRWLNDNEPDVLREAMDETEGQR